MKKSLVALAVLAASGAAMAQSSVTLYGLADVWLGSAKAEINVDGNSQSERATLLDSGGLNTSRWGLKGSEDLGGGLKANFNFESAVAVDTGVSSGFNRQSWVGVSGGFGEVQLGKMWTSYDDVRSAANDTYNANIASSFSTWVGYSDRTNNGIKYTSPNFGGFSGSLTYALGEDKTQDNGASSVMALGLHYANGPLVVGFAHQEQKQEGVNGVFSAIPGFLAGIGDEELTDAIDALDFQGKTTYNLINGSYDFGVAKVVGGYNQVKQTFADTSDTAKAKEFNLGVEVPLASSLKVGMGYSRSDVEFGGEDLFDTRGYSLAAIYSLSKRTELYAALTNTKLEFADNVGDVKLQLVAVGVKHSF